MVNIPPYILRLAAAQTPMQMWCTLSCWRQDARVAQTLPVQGSKGQGEPFVMQLDVEVAAPTFVLPRCTDSSDHMRVNLGSLSLSNAVSWALDDGTAQHQVGLS